MRLIRTILFYLNPFYLGPNIIMLAEESLHQNLIKDLYIFFMVIIAILYIILWLPILFIVNNFMVNISSKWIQTREEMEVWLMENKIFYIHWQPNMKLFKNDALHYKLVFTEHETNRTD